MSDIIYEKIVEKVANILLISSSLNNAIHTTRMMYGEKGLKILSVLCLSALE